MKKVAKCRRVNFVAPGARAAHFVTLLPCWVYCFTQFLKKFRSFDQIYRIIYWNDLFYENILLKKREEKRDAEGGSPLLKTTTEVAGLKRIIFFPYFKEANYDFEKLCQQLYDIKLNNGLCCMLNQQSLGHT